MPVKKTAAKKVAAKKTPAKKTAAKKTTSTKSASQKQPSLGENICSAIKSGQLDGYLAEIDSALETRLAERSKEEAKKKTSTPKPAEQEKKVAPAPKKQPPAAKVTPEKGKTYQIATKFKALAGAKVEFTKFKTGTDKKVDKTKAVVIMKTDKPGNPKGKRVVIPTSALEEVPARKGKK
jgi:DNA-binding protein HU-beta